MNAEQAKAVRREIATIEDGMNRTRLQAERDEAFAASAAESLRYDEKRLAELEHGLNIDALGSSRYRDALHNYTTVLREALTLAEDGFKAPELNVFKIRDVQEAAWEVQVQYAAMMRNSDEKREH